MARGELHVQLSVQYADDEKFEKVSRNSRLLYVDSLCSAKKLLNDGVFSPVQVHKMMYPESKRAAQKAAAELVDAGLWIWDKDRGVYVIAAWLKRNKSRSQIEQDRHDAEEASLKANHKRWHIDRGERDPKCSLCAEQKPPKPSGTGSQGGQRSESTETETERETEKKSQPPVAPRSARTSPPEPEGDPGPAESIVRTWMQGCNRRPPSRVVDDVGRVVVELLREGVPAADVERGLYLWQSRGSNPKTLPSFVNQVMNARPSNVVALPARPSTTDQRVQAGLDLAAKYAAAEETS